MRWYIDFALCCDFKMPAENLEHEGLAKNPNLELAQFKFMLTLGQHKNDALIKQKLMDAIVADSNFIFCCVS